MGLGMKRTTVAMGAAIFFEPFLCMEVLGLYSSQSERRTFFTALCHSHTFFM